jgi:cell division protein FtsB
MFSISLAGIFVIVSLARSIITLSSKGSYVGELKSELTAKEQENAALKDKFSYVQSPAYIEKQAREKFNLQKDGEVVVVLPKDLPKPSILPTSSSSDEPNWLAWWKLFF